MSATFRLDLIAPPYAGHLYPALGAVAELRSRGDVTLRCGTTASGLAAVRRAGIEAWELLPEEGADAAVREIASGSGRVASNPLRMLRQFRANLDLMERLRDQLRSEWSRNPPDLVLVDFAVPFAGLMAQELSIPWWTGMPTPCALETFTGPPPYLGGWRPRPGRFGKLRDACGRSLVRTFKRTIATLWRRRLRRLGVMAGPYLSDGWEVLYSPERILGYAMNEFEFDRGWPEWFEFVGPISADPGIAGAEPEFQSGRRTCLITLGTHVPWAKRTAIDLFRRVAARLPDWDFHFSWGDASRTHHVRTDNLQEFSFVSYERFLSKYDAVVMHGGTGILYACLRDGLPMLVWPQDYDQFDHAARIVHHHLGERLKVDVGWIAAWLTSSAIDAESREVRERFRVAHTRYNAPRRVTELVDQFRHRGGGEGSGS